MARKKFVFKVVLFVVVLTLVVGGVTLIFYVTAEDGNDSILNPGGPGNYNNGEYTPPPDQVFDFSVKDIDGNQFTLSQQTANLILVDLMATWCGPCLDVVTELEMVKDRFGSGLQVISIDIDTEKENDATLRKFRSEHDVKWPMAMDTPDLEAKYDVKSIPYLLLYDSRGNLLEEWEGWRSSNEIIEGCSKHL